MGQLDPTRNPFKKMTRFNQRTDWPANPIDLTWIRQDPSVLLRLLTTKTKQEGLLLTSKEPKKLQSKDHLAREWEA